MERHGLLIGKMIKIFDGAEQFNRFAAEKFVEIANEAIESKRRFAVALAGGSTPKSLYRLLGNEEFRNKIEWSKVFFFFGDERNVAPDDDDSNYRMARENLFEPLKISETNIFRWRTELQDADDIAANYESAIGKFFDEFLGEKNKFQVAADDSNLPRFDLILLGIGADGHTASLFPFTEALSETEKIAAANPVEQLDAIRLTLTFPVINNARNVIFLVRGADKATALREVLEGDFQPDEFPAQNVKPASGDLFWLVDREAAGLLKSKRDLLFAV